MTNKDFYKIFKNIARLLELKGESSFKIRAYERAAEALLGTGVELFQAYESQLLGLEGVGEGLTLKVKELARTGRLEFYEQLCAEFPPKILTLFEIYGLGAKKIKVLYDQLGIGSIAELEGACKEGQVAELPGFGSKTVTKLLEAIDQHKKNAGYFLGATALSVAQALLADLRELEEVSRAELAGDLRRGNEVVQSIDLIVVSKFTERILASFIAHSFVHEILVRDHASCSVQLREGIPCHLHVVSPHAFPFAVSYFTGSKEHTRHLNSLALAKGWVLNERGCEEATDRPLPKPLPEIHEESDIYHALGLQFIPPELREGRGEFIAAAKGNIPRLIEWTQLRGVFHCHTTDSDGCDSLEAMAAEARELGFEYLGIADHSKSSFQAHGLDEKRLIAQQKRIAKWNAQSPDLRIFAGTECDILKDGTLDFSDEVLSSLDYVVASVHSSFSLSEAEMTRRIIRAISHPHVTMLGHLSGRLLLRRSPYAVNKSAVLEAAAQTGTWIELNASPERLDMDWKWWPIARELGVKCVINPDAHSVQGIHNVAFGIRSARKGWLTPADVINCLPLTEVSQALNLQKKKS